MIDIIFKIRNRVIGRKRIKYSNLPNEQNIEKSLMKFKEFHLKICKSIAFKNKMFKKKRKKKIIFVTTGASLGTIF